MTLQFTLLHSLPERTRIRWAGDFDERAGVDDISSTIATIPGVTRVDARPATGSIVIEHEETNFDTLRARLAETVAIEFLELAPARQPAGLETIQRGYRRLDQRLGRTNVDLNSMTFLLMLVLAATQAARGNIGGSAVSFLWYALAIAKQSPRAESAPDGGSAAELKSI